MNDPNRLLRGTAAYFRVIELGTLQPYDPCDLGHFDGEYSIYAHRDKKVMCEYCSQYNERDTHCQYCGAPPR